MPLRPMLIIGVSLLLASCATASDLREAGPSLVVTSTKKTEEIRDCLISRAPSGYAASPHAAGWMISRIDTGGFTNFIEALPEGDGSKVSVYGSMLLRHDVRACA
jgi:hypothetical protein